MSKLWDKIKKVDIWLDDKLHNPEYDSYILEWANKQSIDNLFLNMQTTIHKNKLPNNILNITLSYYLNNTEIGYSILPFKRYKDQKSDIEIFHFYPMQYHAELKSHRGLFFSEKINNLKIGSIAQIITIPDIYAGNNIDEFTFVYHSSQGTRPARRKQLQQMGIKTIKSYTTDKYIIKNLLYALKIGISQKVINQKYPGLLEKYQISK